MIPEHTLYDVARGKGRAGQRADGGLFLQVIVLGPRS